MFLQIQSLNQPDFLEQIEILENINSVNFLAKNSGELDSIGDLEEQIQKIKDTVKLSLTNPEIYEDIGIKHPKGEILFGEPGTGKTLLAKGIAQETFVSFLRMFGSELIQKYLGDGSELVRDIFKAAKEYAPSITFIDEIDGVGTAQ